MENTSPIKRDRSYPGCGRLIILEEGTQLEQQSPIDFNSFFSIDFPAMPDQIELARSAEYRVAKSPVTPDGIHVYRGTDPLEIPFEFKLHYLDKEYCKEGALTLLKIAARLHSLVEPIGSSDMSIAVKTAAPITADGKSDAGAPKPGTDAAVASRAGNSSTLQLMSQADSELNLELNPKQVIDPPVTCRLELMATDEYGPGIRCNGYIKNVKVSLLKPWLRGPTSAAFNLPSAANFSFTFVHVPGHGNWISGGAGIAPRTQAYADIIKERFYNTRALQVSQGNQYRGFTRTTK